MSREHRHPVWTLIGSMMALAVLLGAGHPAGAQPRPEPVRLTRLTGPVEILRQGQPPWTPAVLGTLLVERDEIRALAGGSAELTEPDGSTLLLSENTRLALTRLHFDPISHTRASSIAQLVVGKVRAVVAGAALRLVRARDSNFAIATPAAVAAARGTELVVSHDPGGPAGVPPSTFLIGFVQGDGLCFSFGLFQASVLYAGDVIKLVASGGCNPVVLTSLEKAELFGFGNSLMAGHYALSGPYVQIDPNLVDGIHNLAARSSADGPSTIFFPLFPSSRVEQDSTSKFKP